MNVMSLSEPPPAELEERPTPAVVGVVVENHRQFLAFLEHRVGNRATAEDILQDAFVRGPGSAAKRELAERANITASNAGARIFRARAALLEQVVRSCGTCADHGCLNCSCTPKARGCGAHDSSRRA
jgi:DNA-directed RNA polymerase specialized sigma24 family protein